MSVRGLVICAQHLHDEWIAYIVKGQLGLFNGSHDITFSLDYRRLDDGSIPGYGNNRWADGKHVGMCVWCVRGSLTLPVDL